MPWQLALVSLCELRQCRDAVGEDDLERALKLSQMSTGDKLEAVANAFEKGQEDLAARKENVAAAEAKEAESTTTASTTDSTVSKTNGTATT